jgi:hypothetical protein
MDKKLTSVIIPFFNILEFLTIFTNSVRTSQETYSVSSVKANHLMLVTETAAIFCENHILASRPVARRRPRNG